MERPATYRDIVLIITNGKNPQTMYMSVDDFLQFQGRTNPGSRARDEIGEYVMVLNTRIRPKIGVLDLSDSNLFGT